MMGRIWKNQQNLIYSLHDWLSSSRIWSHVYILIHFNAATMGFGKCVCMTSEGMRGKADVSVESCAYLCYNIYVTLSIVIYSIAYKYPRILMLQVKYVLRGKKLPYWPCISEAKEKTRYTCSWNINHNAINLQALAHARNLEFDSIHVGWSFIARFKILALIVYSEF